MQALLEWVGMEVLEVGHVERDCFGVGVKATDLTYKSIMSETFLVAAFSTALAKIT